MSFNSIVIEGRLTRDPELRKTKNDVSVTNFSLAVNRRFDREAVDFFDITAWRQLADLVAAYQVKGNRLLVQGELQIDTYEKDGNTVRKPVIVANAVEFLTPKSESGKASDNNDDSEIPF